MKKFLVDDEVFEVFPNYCVGVVIANGIDNSKPLDGLGDLLQNEIDKFTQENTDNNVRELRYVNLYREAFRKLNINPNKYMCSIESLLKRTQKNKKLPVINPVVDLGNFFSIKYQLPLGAHDIDKLVDNLEIRFTNQDDRFLPMGETEIEIPDSGEFVYVSGNTVKTRRWMWRQSDDGKITEESSNIFFPIDGFIDENEKDVIKLRDELSEFIRKAYNCEVRVGFVDKNNRSFIIE